MHVLHVAARPGALPCREQEYARVLRAVEELLEEGSGGCICASHLALLYARMGVNADWVCARPFGDGLSCRYLWGAGHWEDGDGARGGARAEAHGGAECGCMRLLSS